MYLTEPKDTGIFSMSAACTLLNKTGGSSLWLLPFKWASLQLLKCSDQLLWGREAAIEVPRQPR